ncbi:PQQ-binding-like beta-propeller repeat protein [Roseimicrobium sp. ORNL1]|uniref:outer membrane protein assembly factor BamB family protein n=1 Tax=Roseimicrobium sp. ORNL1 TaxID=2711231 RepID=UPI0013E149AA|nr:PQQ-binding-like beta-propeller repeat protein [Roseimicrobium sp. ORNL1]QIF00412.1 PQQ-binding-like beta-propeller repeat protein [Roseimicrobium sp. ORNL1]
MKRFKHLWTACLLTAALCSIASPQVFGANWPMWRGPTNDGTTEETDLPVKWSTTENVKWKVSLPDRGNSTPVVWGDKVFLTQPIEREGKRLLICFDKKTGNKLWESGTTYKEAELTHPTNPYCSASPATDGERVVAFFGSAGVFCYDMQGKELWKRTDLGRQHHIWGNGTSPVIAGDRIFLNFGPGEKTVLYAFDKKTGKTLWEHNEPGGASGEGAGKKWLGSWSDPLLRKVDNRYELFMTYPGRACAFDPMSGKELWTCDGMTQLVYNSPVYADGLMVAVSSYGGSGMVVKAGGDGNVTSTHRVWHLPKVQQRIGSGVVHEGLYYILTDGGIAECRDLKTGEMVWNERLKGPGLTGQNWSSLVRSGDKLYAANQGGDCFVFKASPKFELLETNSLGEKIIGSIAVSDGLLFIRSYQNLWCIGK